MIHRFPLIAAFATALVGASTLATAEDTASAEHTLGQHPAILVKRQTPQIDPNHFIPAHPAGLYVIAAPSPTYDHPAVAVARMARQASDLERYMAQPPVASAWLRHSTLSVAASATASSH